jgi:4-amino-4-deoxy-L-arabinose transferase-like glycosyltransferase
VAGSYKIFGINDFAASYPAAVFGVLGILGTFLLFELLFTTEIGFLAAVILSLTTVYIKYSRHAMMDSVVAAFGVWCFYCFLRGMRGSPRWYLLAGALGSYVFFCKSVFGVFPVFTIALYLTFTRQFFPLKRPEFWLGALLLALPYGAWIYNQYQVFSHAFIDQHIYRLILAKSGHGTDNDHVYDYVIVLLKYFPIWLPFLMLGFWRALRAQESRHSHRFLLIFFLVYFVLLSVQGTTKTWYFLPALPACAGLAALGLAPLLRRFPLSRINGVYAGLGVLIFLIFHTTNIPLSWDRSFERQIRMLSPYVRAAAGAGYEILGYRMDYYGLNNVLLFNSDHAARIVESAEGLSPERGKVAVIVATDKWDELRSRLPGLHVLKKTEDVILGINGELVTEGVFSK